MVLVINSSTEKTTENNSLESSVKDKTQIETDFSFSFFFICFL